MNQFFAALLTLFSFEGLEWDRRARLLFYRINNKRLKLLNLTAAAGRPCGRQMRVILNIQLFVLCELSAFFGELWTLAGDLSIGFGIESIERAESRPNREQKSINTVFYGILMTFSKDQRPPSFARNYTFY